ncbi:MAG: ABC transporter ATP-binding protein [Pseudomonadota bacterium]
MTTSDKPIIRVRNLVNAFGEHVVHDTLDLDVMRGEILGIVGGSGTGKSVLLRTIIGLNSQRSGSVEVFGTNLTALAPQQRREQEKRWGVLFQDGALFSSLTVLQNIQVPLREHSKMSAALMDRIANFKVTLVGLPDNAGPKYPSELSGGMRKRAGLARALALDPDIVFLDEPTAGLDPISAAAFDELILDLRKTLGLTVFMVTHDLDSLYAICDRVAVLAEKRVMAVGPLSEVANHAHPWVKEYFGGPRARAAANKPGGGSGSKRPTPRAQGLHK